MLELFVVELKKWSWFQESQDAGSLSEEPKLPEDQAGYAIDGKHERDVH